MSADANPERVARTADDVMLSMVMDRFSRLGYTLRWEEDRYLLLSPSGVKVWRSSSAVVFTGIVQAIEVDRAERGGAR